MDVVIPVLGILAGAIAGGSVAGWLIADEPVVATACVVIADLIGAALMVPIGAFDVSLLLYPVYYCLANGAIALLIHRRRAVLAAPVPV